MECNKRPEFNYNMFMLYWSVAKVSHWVLYNTFCSEGHSTE